jgi:carboxypeptidase D
MLNALLSALVLAVLCIQAQTRQITPAQMRARQQLAADARRATLLDLAPGPIDFATSQVHKRAAGPKNITFSNPKASGTYTAPLNSLLFSNMGIRHLEFFVDGANIPQVSFDVGPSWAGLMPISGNASETRKVRTLFRLMCNNGG